MIVVVRKEQFDFNGRFIRHRFAHVNVDQRAKRNRQWEENPCIPIGEACRCLRPRPKDHLAAGIEKDTREVTLRNGVRLPTALELIAKINIHYCNYFLRRGRESHHDHGVREEEREAADNEKERKVAGGEERAYVCETKTKASVYICNESFIDVVAAPWRVNYKVEPTIPSLAKRNRSNPFPRPGETNPPRLHPRAVAHGAARNVYPFSWEERINEKAKGRKSIEKNAPRERSPGVIDLRVLRLSSGRKSVI